MQIRVVNFYWVSSAYDNPDSPSWQVQVRKIAESMPEVAQLGGQMQVDVTLDIEQAAELGINLSTLIEGINSDALVRGAQLANENERLKALLNQPQV